MKRIIAYFLILLVLFTNSTMVIGVNIPHDTDNPADHVSDFNFADINNTDSTDSDKVLCQDTGGHCSHQKAHFNGLISVNKLSGTKVQPTLFFRLKMIAFIHTQSPPLRPPKA
jgi:hypothetical protein